MSFLGKLFGNLFGGGAAPRPDDAGLYYYIKNRRSGEVIRVRINRMNDLSQSDDGATFFIKKVIVGTRSFDRIEATFTFSGGATRELLNTEISGGELVDAEAYAADQAAHPRQP
jgi:hypothetical protein